MIRVVWVFIAVLLPVASRGQSPLEAKWVYETFTGSGIVSYSPDGELLAATCDAGVQIRSGSTGALLWCLPTGPNSSIAFSPNGKLLACGFGEFNNQGLYSGQLTIWDIYSRRRLRLLDSHATNHLAFSPDGTTIASSGSDSAGNAFLDLWNVSTGALITPLVSVAGGLTPVAYSPDGTMLAQGCSFYDTHNKHVYAIQLWDLTSFTITKVIDVKPSLSAIAFSPDGRIIGSSSGTVTQLYSIATGALLTTISNPYGGPFTSLAFSPDGTTLATSTANYGSVAARVELWDVATGAQITSLLGSDFQGADSVSFSPDGKRLANGGEIIGNGGGIEVWDVSTGNRIQEIDAGPIISSIAFSLSTDMLAIGGSGGQIDLFDGESGKIEKFLASAAVTMVSVTYSPDGKLLAVAGQDGNGSGVLEIWNAESGRIVKRLPVSMVLIYAIAFSPNSRTLAVGGTMANVAKGFLTLWDASSGRQLNPLDGKVPACVRSLAFSPDGKTLAGVTIGDANVVLWNLSTGKRERTLQLPKLNQPVTVAFAPNGRSIAAGGLGLSDEAALWNPVDGRRLFDLHLNSARNYVSTLVYSPDGKVIFAGTESNLMAFSTFDGHVLGEYSQFNIKNVYSVAISRDGSLLAYAGQETVAVVANPFYHRGP